ncbi:MAG: protein sorting system archaetidylserine synthase [Haloarculaceae archaeon]
MQPRFVGRLGLADAVTVTNAALGFVAAAVAATAPGLAARLLLLAAIADGLDGVIARVRGSTPVGEFLDSLADVASFGVAPALLVYSVVRAEWGLSLSHPTLRTAVALAVPALFVAVAVVRLGLYTAYDLGTTHTQGVQTTLAATMLAVGYLAGVRSAPVVLGATAVFCYLMVAPLSYPELHARDALVIGAVQALTVLFPTAYGRLFPRVLFVVAAAYFVGAPWFYWRRQGVAGDADPGPPDPGTETNDGGPTE